MQDPKAGFVEHMVCHMVFKNILSALWWVFIFKYYLCHLEYISFKVNYQRNWHTYGIHNMISFVPFWEFFLSVVFSIYEFLLLYFECYSNICFTIYWNINDYSCGFWNRVNQKSSFQRFYIRTVFLTTVQLSMCCGSLLLVISHRWYINCLLLKQLSIIHRVYQIAIRLLKCWLEVLGPMCKCVFHRGILVIFCDINNIYIR